jgi:hypothetical protein
MPRVPAVATGVIAVVLAAYWIAAFSGEHRKLATLGPTLPARGSYRVVLDFPPERFHQLMLQDQGRLVEVRGSTVHMMDVRPEALREIARQYWVAAIEPWAP